MNAIAFIFARGGSKGLPGKNIRPFAGKPLIAWAIQHAMAVGRVRRVIVSTNDPEIAKVAKAYGAEVPFLRPVHLAGDDSPEWLAWRHALEFVRDEEGCIPEAMVSVPVTAPLRKPEDIEICLDIFEEGGVDIVITVNEAHRNPYFNMVKANPNGTVGLLIPSKGGITRRQDAPEVFDITTVAYVADPNFVLTHNSTFEGRVKSAQIPIERAIDIDTLRDFQMAEFLYKKSQGT